MAIKEGSTWLNLVFLLLKTLQDDILLTQVKMHKALHDSLKMNEQSMKAFVIYFVEYNLNIK